ncbi:sulfatase-like hydrolase/transferase [Lentisphaerae bacterium WC36]|nr:sulfatase-like hydrolase/transferase [Lentisphaerae bacterium WC36]
MGDVKRAFNFISGGKGPGLQENWVSILAKRPKEKPFFMWLASSDAHHPFTIRKGQGKIYDPDEIDVPPYLYNGPLTRQDMAKYYHEVSRADYYMGKLLAELERQNISDNTYVIFCADNGQPFPRAKTRMYDSGSKSPLIIWSPKKVKPAVSDSMVSLIDIGPTVLNLAGIEKADSMFGVSLKPVLKNRKKSVRDFVFVEHNWHVLPAHERMVRFGDWLYIKNSWSFEPLGCREILPLKDEFPTAYELNQMRKKRKLKPEQLDVYLQKRPTEEFFYVKKDEHQFKNLVNQKECGHILNYARAVLNLWTTETKDSVPDLRYRSPMKAIGYRGHVGDFEKPGDATKAWTVNNPGPIRYSDVETK